MARIVDNIGEVVAAMRSTAIVDPQAPGAGSPYYMFGHRLEIANRLTSKDKDIIFKYQRYPLVALRLPIIEVVKGEITELKLNICIVCKTDKNYNAEQRQESVFNPILNPLYERFFVELRNSGLFMWPNSQDKPEHVRVDRMYFGTPGSEGNKNNIFNDPLDAIEIIDLKINSFTNQCQ